MGKKQGADSASLGVTVRWWFEMMRVSVVALYSCTLSRRDPRTFCLPSIQRNVVGPEDAIRLISAAEAKAADLGGYTTRRHADYPTTDLPVAMLENVSDIVDRAATNAIRGLVARCEAPANLEVYDAFLVKYEDQKSLQPHLDGGRYSATVALSRPRETPGVHWPAPVLEDAFYHKKLCPPSCLGEPCDLWRSRGHSLEELETHWHCSCSLCAFDAIVDDRDQRRRKKNKAAPWPPPAGFGAAAEGDYDYDGGGTLFPELRNVRVVPKLGDAVIHGANQPHGGADITSGQRFLLAFFFDVPLCRKAEKDYFDTFMLSLLLIAVALVLAYVSFVADFSDALQDEEKKLDDKRKLVASLGFQEGRPGTSSSTSSIKKNKKDD